MKTFYSDAHAVHVPAFEFAARRLSKMPECPARAETVRASIQSRRFGERIAQVCRPPLFIFKGGYDLETLGDNVANVLEGFLQAG